MKTNQDFFVIRGDDVQQPFAISLDEERTLDGTETWQLQVRLTRDAAAAIFTITSPTGITLDSGTYQPTAIFTPTELSLANFPAANSVIPYVYDLEMTKDAKVETVAQGIFRVLTDVSR